MANKNKRSQSESQSNSGKAKEQSSRKSGASFASKIRPSKLVSKSMPVNILVFGAVAYVGLRLLNRSGIFSHQTGAALDAIDRTWAGAKRRVMGSSAVQMNH